MFNGQALDARGYQALRQLEARFGARVPDGHYWYDRRSGAAGRWGGPSLVFFPPGLPLGGRLSPRASGGGTGLYINGREVHPIEYRRLAVLFRRPPPRGYYWLDANGDMGAIGSPALINLVALARQHTGNRGGARGGHWSVYQRGIGGRGGIGVAGDGKTTCVNTASYTRCY